VIESAPEQLEIKRGLFAQFDRLCPPHAVLATNSSSLRISALEDATQRPGQVLNMRIYRPLADAWVLYDNSGAQPVLLEWGETQ
jgi:3-hydroxybutyryl-CoA dehydrogenase